MDLDLTQCSGEGLVLNFFQLGPYLVVGALLASFTNLHQVSMDFERIVVVFREFVVFVVFLNCDVLLQHVGSIHN
jgi:sulfite exporter TauE/SafE